MIKMDWKWMKWIENYENGLKATGVIEMNWHILKAIETDWKWLRRIKNNSAELIGAECNWNWNQIKWIEVDLKL